MNGKFSMEAAAKAHTNIALIKYWGKRNEELFLPMNSSLSITLDRFYTITKVHFCDDLKKDILILNENIAGEKETAKISQFLDQIRNLAKQDLFAIVRTTNHVPTAAGFASSASGFAALAAAASKAIGLDLDEKSLSRLARQGSGSACRSIFGGFVEWQKGISEDGKDSFATPIKEGDHWNLSILSVMLTNKQKQISSRDGMKAAVLTSPYYPAWVYEAEDDLKIAKEAIMEHDFEKLGQTAEANALKMHATTLSASPPFCYWESSTVDVMNRVRDIRASGIPAYFTIDAGPNVKVLCEPINEKKVQEALLVLPGVLEVHTCHPGPGVEYLSSN